MQTSILGRRKSHLLVTTGLASVAAISATSQAAQAEGMYAGLSYGMFQGDNPIMPGDPDDYELDGGAVGMFVGKDFATFGNGMFVGGELAFTGPVDGDPNEESSYDHAYDINWMADAKLRVGGAAGNFKYYAFGGLTLGNGNNYGPDYAFSGANYGLGVEATFGNNMFVGLEAVQRQINGYGDSGDGPMNHTAVSLRAGLSF